MGAVVESWDRSWVLPPCCRLASHADVEERPDMTKPSEHHAHKDDWWCETCKRRVCGGPDQGMTRASCPKCGYWMLSYWEHRGDRLRECVTDLLRHLEETACSHRYRSDDLKGSISRARELLT